VPLRPCCTSCERTLDDFLSREVPGESPNWSPAARKKKEEDEQWERTLAKRREMPGTVPVQASGVFDATVQKQLEEEEIISDEEDNEGTLKVGKEYPLKVDEVAVLEEQGVTRRQLGIPETEFEETIGETGVMETTIAEDDEEELEDEKDEPFESALGLNIRPSDLKAAQETPPHISSSNQPYSAIPPSSSVFGRLRSRTITPPEQTRVSDSTRARQRNASVSYPNRELRLPAQLPVYKPGNSFWNAIGAIGRAGIV